MPEPTKKPLPPMRPKATTLPGIAPPPSPVRRPELAVEEVEEVEAVPEPAPEPHPIPLVPRSPDSTGRRLRERKRRSAPTVFIPRPKPPASKGWAWGVIFFVLAASTGIGGWYLGHRHKQPAHAVQQPTTQSAAPPSIAAPPPPSVESVTSALVETPPASAAPSHTPQHHRPPVVVHPRPHPTAASTSPTDDPATL